jgi:hypothetical protein
MKELMSMLRFFLEGEKSYVRLLSSIGELNHRNLIGSLGNVKNLWGAEYSVFSQWGEDGILDFLCESLGIERPTVVDFGAGDVRYSNFRWLLQSRGGSGVFVDARPDLAESLDKSGLRIHSDTHVISTFLNYENSNDTLKKSLEILRGKELDFFSLDIDGQDYWVLESLREIDAKVILLEYQSYLGPKLAVTVPRSLAFNRADAHFSMIYYGASLLAFKSLLDTRGYKLVGSNRQRSNAFFVRKDLIAGTKLAEIEIPTLFQLTDGLGGESRDFHGEFKGMQGAGRTELIKDLAWFNCETSEIETLAEITKRTSK